MKKRFVLLFLGVIFILSCFASCGESENIKTAVNDISSKFVKSNVEISVVYEGPLKDEVLSYGCGVIVDSTYFDSYYTHKVLTCEHVVNIPPKYPENKIKIYVVDYALNYNSTYLATVIKKDEQNGLALLSFETYNELNCIEIGDKVSEKQVVFSVGQLNDLSNAITIGKVLGFVKVETETKSFSYNFIKHDALIANGSSGSMLLNDKGVLIGLNYGGKTDEKGEFSCGYAIPADIIKSFLTENK